MAGGPGRTALVTGSAAASGLALVRFEGDAARAAQVYEGTTPLTAEDVAETIAFVVTRPLHVDVDYVSVKPTAQATARDVHRS